MNNKPPHIYQGCLRKVGFKSVDQAIECARKRNLRYYYCSFCFRYHLTKSEYNSWAPDPIKKEKPERIKTKGLRLADNKIKDIIKEDSEYYYIQPSKKNKYTYLYVIGSSWELVEEGIRIKKALLEEKGIKVVYY